MLQQQPLVQLDLELQEGGALSTCVKIVYYLSTYVQKSSTVVNFPGVRGALSQQGHVYLRQGITSISQTVSFSKLYPWVFSEEKNLSQSTTRRT